LAKAKIIINESKLMIILQLSLKRFGFLPLETIWEEVIN